VHADLPFDTLIARISDIFQNQRSKIAKLYHDYDGAFAANPDLEFSDYLLTTKPDPRTILVIDYYDYYDYDVTGIFEHIHQAIELNQTYNAITIIATVRPGPMSHFIRKSMDYALFLSCTPETVQSIAFWLPSRPATFAMHAMTHLVSLHPGLSLVVTLKESIYYYSARRRTTQEVMMDFGLVPNRPRTLAQHCRYAIVVAHHWICTKRLQVQIERFVRYDLDAMLRQFNDHVPAHLRYPE
jgi:hypothetical protein